MNLSLRSINKVDELTKKANDINNEIPPMSNDWYSIRTLMQQACAQFFLHISNYLNPNTTALPSIPVQALLRILIEYSIVIIYMAQDPEERAKKFVDFSILRSKHSHESARKLKLSVNSKHGKRLKVLTEKLPQDLDPQTCWGRSLEKLAVKISEHGNINKDIKDNLEKIVLAANHMSASVHPSFLAVNSWREESKNVDLEFISTFACFAFEAALSV